MEKYSIHDTSEGINHGQIVFHQFTHNPIPEGVKCIILFEDMRIEAKVDMNFHTNPNFSIFEILKVTNGHKTKRTRTGTQQALPL